MDYPHVVRNEPSAETDQVARSVVCAAMDVHRALGPGFVEVVYESALCEEAESTSARVASLLPTGSAPPNSK
jgi:hypothetical protein